MASPISSIAPPTVHESTAAAPPVPAATTAPASLPHDTVSLSHAATSHSGDVDHDGDAT